MAEPSDSKEQITLTIASQRTGLSVGRIRRYMRRELVGQTLTETELARLRRIRRLSELGMNLAGIEVILRMRAQIEALQEAVSTLQDLQRELADQADWRAEPAAKE